MTGHDLSRDTVDRVRQAADIVAVVGEVVSLRKAGKNYVGLCPFHGERTPSFYVSPDKGTFYCFGCKKGGSVFDFVMETQHLGFAEAVELLAKRFGVSLPPASPERRRRAEEGEALRQALEAAQSFFTSRLTADRPRAFLEARGISLPQAQELGLGYAPAGWRELTEALQRQGFSERVLTGAGLAVQGEQGRLWDRFRDRITIPIRTFRGELVAFGARAVGDAQPKYLNSPETPLFSKSTVLFGGERAARAMAQTGEAIVVEGYFDCLALHLAGFHHAVATLGTALSEHHARELARRASRVILCFDGDEAGRRAAAAALGTLLAANVEVGVVLLPEGVDPDLFLRQQGAEAFRKLLATPATVGQFLLRFAGDSLEARRRQLRQALEVVERCPDPVRRYTLKEELARGAGVPVDQLESLTLPQPLTAGGTLPPVPAGELSLLRALVVDTPEPRRAELLQRIPVEELQHPLVVEVLQAMLSLLDEGRPLEISALGTHIKDREARRLVAALEHEAPQTSEEGLEKILRELWERQRKKQLAALSDQVRRAQIIGDREALAAALREMQALLSRDS